METFVMFWTLCVQTRAREDGNIWHVLHLCVQTRVRKDGHIWHVLHFLRANKGKGRWSYLACFALCAYRMREGKITIFGSEGKMSLISACLHINLSASIKSSTWTEIN